MRAPDLYVYAAMVTDVIDGDTVDCAISCGLWVSVSKRLRLCASNGAGINAPETRGPERSAGLASKAHLLELLDRMAGRGWPVYVRTFRDRTGKYGRLLADVFVMTGAGPVSLCDRMVEDGHAVLRSY